MHLKHFTTRTSGGQLSFCAHCTKKNSIAANALDPGRPTWTDFCFCPFTLMRNHNGKSRRVIAEAIQTMGSCISATCVRWHRENGGRTRLVEREFVVESSKPHYNMTPMRA